MTHFWFDILKSKKINKLARHFDIYKQNDICLFPQPAILHSLLYEQEMLQL